MLESFEVLLLAVSCSLKGSEEMFYERALSVFSSQHNVDGIGSTKDGRF